MSATARMSPPPPAGPAVGARQVSEFLAEVEETLPVDEWRIGGLRVWPLLRNYHAFALVTRHEYDANSQIVRYSGGLRRMRQIATALRDEAVAKRRDRAGNQPPGQAADVTCLVASSTRFFRIGGRWYTPYCDSFREPLERRGLRVSALELASDGAYRIPRYSPSALLQNAVSLRTLAARARSRLVRREEHLPGYEAMVAVSDRRLGPGLAYALDTLRFRAAQVETLRVLFRRVLAAARPAVGLLTGYYSADAMAYILACRDLGILPVEVQHGVQGDWHFAYSRWARVPAGGYELLPRVFWTWDEHSRAVIASWAASTGGAHEAFLGGNPCLSLPPDASALRIDPTWRVRILFTAQAFYGVPPAVMEAMAASPAGWHWWIRVHPQYWETRSALVEALTARGLSNWSIDDATTAPLASVLAASHVHVTEFSSSVLEAEALEVPSVVLHEKGRQLFAAQLRTGIARFAEDGEAVTRAVADFAAPAEARGAGATRVDRTFANGCEWLAQTVEGMRERTVAGT